MRRLFCIWNRGYTTQISIALTIDEALQVARDAGHIRRGHRRWKDLTEAMDEAVPGLAPASRNRLLAALNAGRSGVAVYSPEQGWLIGGKPAVAEEDLPPIS